MSSLLGTKDRETCVISYPLWIQLNQLQETWITYYFYSVSFLKHIIYESKDNTCTNYTLKRYVSVSDSGFLNNWVQDDESVLESVEKLHFYSCAKIDLWWIIWARKSRQNIHLRQDNTLMKACIVEFYLFSIQTRFLDISPLTLNPFPLIIKYQRLKSPTLKNNKLHLISLQDPFLG